MSPWLSVISVAVLGYLIGSISFAVLIARRKGVDIFSVGSGNPGATNVKRSIGKREGNLCFALDAFKGIVAAACGLLPLWHAAPPLPLPIVGMVAAILGHSFSVFIGFRGGKGVATTMGGLLVILPVVLLVGVLVWLAVFKIWRYVSLASICMGISLPISSLFLADNAWELGISLLLAVIIVVRHRSNIQRLLKGEELGGRKRAAG